MTQPIEPGPAAWTPQYEPPGLSIRATFLATDGTRPQEVVVEWKHEPGQAMTMMILDKIAEMAAPGEVRTVIDHADRQSLEEADPVLWAGALDESTTQLPRPYCGVTGPAHNEPGHGCSLYYDHDPVEPGGRAHRCRCGGIFGTEEEHPAPPGRFEQARRRRLQDG